MIFFRSIYVLMPLTVILAFLWAPSAAILGNTSRILYFHVPAAWVSVLAFLVSGVYSLLHLAWRRDRMLDEKAANSAAIGILFTVLAIISGSVWARMAWGSFWNWDPRQTSIIILLLLYIAFFSLRGSLTNPVTRGNVTASYLLIAMITVPFFTFIVPRLYPSLHPDPVVNPEGKINLENKMRITLLVASVSFTVLYGYLLLLRNRVTEIQRLKEERDLI
jgi:heme exporter protein C